MIGLAAVTWIHRSEGSSRRRLERARRLGAGMGVAVGLVIAPFWLVAAAKVGKIRRQEKVGEQSGGQ